MIIRHYRTRLLKDIAADLGRKPGALRAHVAYLRRAGKLKGRRCYQPPWTAQDDDYLRDTYGKVSDKYLAGQLQRSVEAVRSRAFVLGISKREQVWTAAEVGRLFGVDQHKVVEQWIGGGVLAARQVKGGGFRGYYWSVSDEAMETFIRRYPWHYDRRRIEPRTYYRNLAEAVWQADPLLTVDEAAARVGTHREIILRHIRRGWLRAERTWAAGNHGQLWLGVSWLAAFRKRRPGRRKRREEAA